MEVTVAANTIRSGGPLTGTGNLDIKGPGIVSFGKNSVTTLGNTYSGTLTVKSGGTLDIRNPDSMGATGTSARTVIEAGGTLLINPFSQPLGVAFNAETLEFQGTSTLINRNQSPTAATTNTLQGPVSIADTLNVYSLSSGGAATLELSGAITGSGGINFGGSGQAGIYLMAGNSNTYSGPTALTAGTLVINGDQTSATGNVSVSGTLAGNGGTVGGNTTVNSGGKLALGNGTAGSVGSETFKGDLTLAADSIFNWDLTAESTATGFDQVIGTSGKTFDATASAFRVITDQSFDTLFWDVQRNWTTIFSTFGTTTGWAANTPVAVYTTLGVLRTDVAVEGSFTVTGGNLSWNFSPVPEPTSALAGMLMGAGLLRRRRS